MKKIYISPEMEITLFYSNDVITTSSLTNGGSSPGMQESFDDFINSFQ